MSRMKLRRGLAALDANDDFDFESDAVLVDDSLHIPTANNYYVPPPPKMINGMGGGFAKTMTLSSRRLPAQDGPWTISVAEVPPPPLAPIITSSPRKRKEKETKEREVEYTLYIKTPTHNLTLTRGVTEICSLDDKLRDLARELNENPSGGISGNQQHVPITVPPFPLDVGQLQQQMPKRKSTFLNTLSRLASPNAKAGKRLASSGPAPAAVATNGVPSSTDDSDPFLAPPSPATHVNGTSPRSAASSTFDSNTVTSSVIPPSSPTSTNLSSYLTTISNTPAFRNARVWKRFVRVRTDDLESVRVERALKRVRSDLVMRGSLGGDENLVGRTIPPAHRERGDDKENVAVNDVEMTDEIARVDKSTTTPTVSKEKDAITQEVTSQEHVVDLTTPVPPSTIAVLSSNSSLTSSPAQSSTALDSSTDISTSTHVDAEGEYGGGTGTETETTETGEDDSMSASYPSPSASKTKRKKKKKKSSLSTSAPGSGATSAAASQTLKKKISINDFSLMRVLGKGCAGKVLLVRHKASNELYALKAITKRHVLAHQELQHTLTEQAVLKRMALGWNVVENGEDRKYVEGGVRDPFVVRLWWSFHDRENLYLVMDFHPGGDLATQLARWGRLGRDRARFYAAEIVEGVEGLHHAGVIYRDLKPENILIGGDGHIVLTDFGLSKEFPRRWNGPTSTLRAGRTAPATPTGSHPAAPPWQRIDPRTGEMSLGWPSPRSYTHAGGLHGRQRSNTNDFEDGVFDHEDETTGTFCGTAEYLAPEVIQGLQYSYEIDWWSFGTMLFEMLTGITPFWANNHSDMYVRVLQDELVFPDDRSLDQDTKSLIRGLLQRDPHLRMSEPRIKKHPYFSMIDWSHVYYKRYIPPYIPPIDPSNETDTQNFDEAFLGMEPVIGDDEDDDVNGEEESSTSASEREDDRDLQPNGDDVKMENGDGRATPTTQSGSSSMVRKSSVQAQAKEEEPDVFDGYSFKGRHSVIIDDEDDDGSAEEGSDEGSSDEDGEEGSEEGGTTGTGTEESLSESNQAVEDEDEDGRKTPVLKPPTVVAPQPAESTPVTQPQPVEEKPRTSIIETSRKSKELPQPQAVVTDEIPPALPEKTKPAVPAKQLPSARQRKEKSGVAALDRYASFGEDDYDEDRHDIDEEDEDWDFVETGVREDKNGARGTTLFERGFVDRYKLTVFRKPSSSTQASGSSPKPLSRMGSFKSRTFSSGRGAESESELNSPPGTPSLTKKRSAKSLNPLKFRTQTRQFLKPKSSSSNPPSSFSYASSKALKSHDLEQSNGVSSNAQSLSAASTMSSTGTKGSLSGSLSHSGTLSGPSSATTPVSPSLKSKESAISVGATSSSDQSANGDANNGNGQSTSLTNSIVEEPEKTKNKKLKKYKENAEKVLSLFSSSPKQQPTNQQA